VASEAECRRAADALVGQRITRVLYVGLTYDSADPDIVRWDFGDWHWPEAGVELTSSDGTKLHAIWDSQITHFELTLEIGPISDVWRPLQEDPPTARAWDVTHHPRWAPLIGPPIVGYDLALSAPDDPLVVAPVAVRLATASSLVWLAAAAPRRYEVASEDLTAKDVYVGHDEAIVAFTDARADRIGLQLRP
jgi:hypothetical protein